MESNSNVKCKKCGVLTSRRSRKEIKMCLECRENRSKDLTTLTVFSHLANCGRFIVVSIEFVADFFK